MDDTQRTQFKREVVALYDRAAHLYDQVGANEFTWFGRRLVEWLDVPSGAAALDIASGRGAILFALADRVEEAGHVIGIDLSAGMVRETQAQIEQRGLTNAEIRLMDADQLTFADASFDLITCGFALHFLDYERLLPRLYRLLKPGGQLAIIQPTQTDQAENERWRWLFDLTRTCFPPDFVPPLAWRAPNPLRERTLLQPIFQNAGFTDIRFADDAVKRYWVDADDWWNWEWSQGSRFWLEGMTPEALERFKTESFRHLQAMREPEGIAHIFTALYAAGRKTA